MTIGTELQAASPEGLDIELRNARPSDAEPVVHLLRAARERWLSYAPSAHSAIEDGA
jgi:hypothetical protein